MGRARQEAPTLLTDQGGVETLTGEVAEVVFAATDTGFGVVELAAADGSGPRASGPLAELVPGQPVRLVGRWTEHERYGPTFRATYYERADPQTAAGLSAFLASDRFPGVGQRLARRLVDHFGTDLGAVIEADPQRLAEVRGVSPELAGRVCDAWRRTGALAGLVADLASVGIPAGVAQSVHRHFGDEASAVLADDPYAILDVRGAGWSNAEALARAATIDHRDERRLAAGARTAHAQLCARGGHVATDTGTLVTETGRLLGVDGTDAARALTVARERGRLALDDGAPPCWYTPADLSAERHLAADVARLLAGRSRVAPAAGGLTVDEDLTGEQARAVRAAVTTPVTVLTGGPGTGKTRTVVALTAVCEEAGLQVALCAPTGRAAKRVEELTGHAATTIHRLLEARGSPDDGAFRFGYDHRRRLPYDVVVADEWSMADVHLARALARAVDDGAHLVLVGDADQLPSVGPGAVLRDLCDPAVAGLVPATRLSTIHRQAASSRIVTLAHEINAGTVGRVSGNMGDVFAVPERPAGIAERIAEIVATRAPDYFGCRPADVQVLAPMYRGPAGVDRLNDALKSRLNPSAGRPTVAGFQEGDRVVQTRNDADLDVANGDVGEVVAADRGERTLEVAFPQGTVTYRASQAADLAPAWCLTVHKAQGGEWPVVVLALDASHRPMLWRELVYTAVTRARTGLLLVGRPELVADAARRTRSGARNRRTRLASRIVAAARRPVVRADDREADGDAAAEADVRPEAAATGPPEAPDHRSAHHGGA